MAYALKLAMLYRGATEVEHYLDDYINMGPSNSPSCNRNLKMLDTWFYGKMVYMDGSLL